MERFFKLYLLLVEVTIDVVQELLRNRYNAENIQDFTDFLQHYKHELFHLCFKKFGQCCVCLMRSPVVVQQQAINKTQFEKLFSKSGNISCGTKIGNHCCKYDVNRNFTLKEVDVTLGVSLILNFCQPPNKQEADCLGDIRTIRNEVAHHSVNSDIPEGEFKAFWGKACNASLYLASCLSKHYRCEVDEKISLLDKRDIRVSESSTLMQRALMWQRENDERIDGLALDLKSFRSKHEEDLQSVHGKLDQLLAIDRTSNLAEQGSEVHGRLLSRVEDSVEDEKTKVLKETILRCESVENTQCLEDQEYFQLFNEVEKLRLRGKGDQTDALQYIILCYIVLRGSVEEDMEIELLESMSSNIFGCSLPQSAGTKSCLQDLIPKFVEKIESTYTASSVNVLKAVIYSVGEISPDCLVEVCTADILDEFVIPDNIETDIIFVRVNKDSLARLLIQKLDKQASGIGKYIRKLQQMEGGKSFLDFFIDSFVESDKRLSADHMISFLGGLTKEGEDFNIFEEEKMLNVICRHVDQFENTIFHYLVINYLQSNALMRYIIFFSGEKNISMLMPNIDNLTPLSIAAYLGRYGAVSSIVHNMEREDLYNQLWEILMNVLEGIELLQMINSSKEGGTSKVRVVGMERMAIGGKEEFRNILDVLKVDVSSFECRKDESNGNTGEEDKDRSHEVQDTSKVVGDKLISLVTNIKKGLDALTKIPDLVKTIHQATKLEN